MEEATLFVLPPHPQYICPAHGGIMQNPVTNATCNHSFCEVCASEYDACPIDRTTMQVSPNAKLQGDIDSLLCYCKFGVMRSTSGELIPNPKGCSAIIKYSNRLNHEATCDFNEKDFCFIEIPPPSPPSHLRDSPLISHSPISISDHSSPLCESPMMSSPSLSVPEIPREVQQVESSHPLMILTPCPNKDDGCFFLAESDQELSTHLAEECSYERLRVMLRVRDETIALLQQELIQRDDEIINLKQNIERKPHDEDSLSAEDFGDDDLAVKAKELWDEISKVFGEEIPNGLNNAREVFLQSAAFQRSAHTVAQIRSKITRKAENVKNELNDLRPLDKILAVINSFKEELAVTIKENIKNQSQKDLNTTTTTSSNEKKGKQDEEDDPELKKQLEASLATFEAEKHAREQIEAFEAAAIAAAAAQSLIEQQQLQQVDSDDDLTLVD